MNSAWEVYLSEGSGLPDILTRQTLIASLLGEWNLENGPLSRTEEIHLQKRFQVRIQYGHGYEELVDAMLALFLKNSTV